MHFKLIVAGGGPAGIAAAIEASKNGVDTLLLEAGDGIGGYFFSGMPILGAYTSRGVQCVKGILDEIIDACKSLSTEGYIGPVCDFRTVYGLCIDPEILRLAVYRLLKKYNVKILLNSRVVSSDVCNETVRSLSVQSENSSHTISCDCAVDATGGGHLTAMCGGGKLAGSSEGEFQPISLTFRMCNVDFESLLNYIRENPEEALLSENPVMEEDRFFAAKKLYEAGYPYVAISATGQLMGNAIKNRRLHPCTAAFITPSSLKRKEVCMNVSRVSSVNCTDDFAVSDSVKELAEQAGSTADFFKNNVPGFSSASISSIMHKTGIRETGRIIGEHTITQEDVVAGARFPDAIAQGCHHVDIHGRGKSQIRIPVRGGGTYDIPYKCLLPRGIKNVIAAGRCLSSDRGANGSARVMGTCIATGQAAGAASVIYWREAENDFRNIMTSKITSLVGL